MAERYAVAEILGERHLDEGKAHVQLAGERGAVRYERVHGIDGVAQEAALLRDRRVWIIAVVRGDAPAVDVDAHRLEIRAFVLVGEMAALLPQAFVATVDDVTNAANGADP